LGDGKHIWPVKTCASKPLGILSWWFMEVDGRIQCKYSVAVKEVEPILQGARDKDY